MQGGEGKSKRSSDCKVKKCDMAAEKERLSE